MYWWKIKWAVKPKENIYIQKSLVWVTLEKERYIHVWEEKVKKEKDRNKRENQNKIVSQRKIREWVSLSGIACFVLYGVYYVVLYVLLYTCGAVYCSMQYGLVLSHTVICSEYVETLLLLHSVILCYGIIPCSNVFISIEFFISPYFHHDAFMRHAFHVFDATFWNL